MLTDRPGLDRMPPLCRRHPLHPEPCPLCREELEEVARRMQQGVTALSSWRQIFRGGGE